MSSTEAETWFLTVMIVFACCPPIWCYSETPFTGQLLEEVCSSLIPGHGYSRKPSVSSYQLNVLRGPLRNQIRVRLVGVDTFIGFIIQANWNKGKVLPGQNYTDAGCTKPTIRHINSQPKRSVEAVFQMDDDGNVALTGTVVKSYEEYYRLDMVFL